MHSKFEIGLFTHMIIWTENQADAIRDEARTALYDRLREIISEAGCTCIALNGTANHIHLLVSFTVNTVLDTLVENTKEKSAEWFRIQDACSRDFRWAEGYAAFTVGESDLPDLKTYLKGQKTYHKRVSLKDELIGLLTEHGIDFDEEDIF